MKISARNTIKGTVKNVVIGQVSAEVTIDLGNGKELVSVITKNSVENLGIKVGKEVYAVVKASSVMIATD
ncbi:TOBE domain-containing protein [uncultured Methanomethylovorans sp.]|uniref:TOBE domain-containing protein n=1 Tax=uncultured Methanomethylovorans sp. TaxID=183759 RepID=UPI002AA7617B|nr:TOBE domain-containing protein [uncultured Methanomethylovorans sp.]